MVRQANARGVKLDTVLVPCGGGGVVTGVALALSGISPETLVVSVEPVGFDGMRRSLETGERVSAPGGSVSMADALMAPTPGHIPFALAKRHMKSGLNVTEDALAKAVAYGASNLKLIIEPGGGAGLAALLGGSFDAGGRCVGVVLTGGNCDFETIAACVARASRT
jgi:threonine dehydratase